ncbi:ATP-binding protein [Ideonella sp. BN130291]|uniref:ATP-binding protein n=1 Tax=Ideonella sp. BN130291 TaxID=3112940 RepID=UPI002E25833B|nr:ATP-binding protein [Ideonella sp. BN130291]
MSVPAAAVSDPPAGEPAAVRSPAWRWLAGPVLGVAAMALRAALEPWMAGSVPFVFAFTAVVAATLLAGAGAGMLTVAVCAVMPLIPGMPGILSAAPAERQLLVFVVSAVLLVAVCSWLMRQRPVPVVRDEAQSLAAEEGRHVQLWLRLSMALALLLPAAFFVSTAWQSRAAAYQDAQQRITRSAVIAREHALKIMHTSRLLVQQMQDRFDGKSAAEIDAARPALEAALARLKQGLPDVQGIAVWDRDGKPLATSDGGPPPPGLNALQREYFRRHRDSAEPGLLVSPPIESQVQPGQWRIVVSQRRSGPRGEFDGVYAVALHATAFTDFYRDLVRSERSGTVSLFRQDGTIIARAPAPPTPGMVQPASGPMMQRVRAGDNAGLLETVSPVDGQHRLVAFRRLEGQPLVVAASISHEAVLSSWYREVALLAAFTFPTALGLAWVSWVALRHTQRERVALDRWRAETVKRAQAEDALRQTQRLEALGHLTGGVAHDVNNLLMVVSNNAYLLRRLLQKEGMPAAAQARADKPIDAILRAVTTGARLTRQLLAFARRQALRPEVVSLQERLPLLLDLMRHSVPAVVALDGQAAPDTGHVQVDPAELELALINLAVNARDAMPQGGQLSVEVRNAQPQEHEGLGQWVSITVRDTGQGIAPELLDRVFEPFFTTKEQGKGTGLGLSQVYGFCQQAGGTARIESTPGQGTAVQLLLPAVNATPEATQEPPPVPSVEGRLLLVEDNAEVAEATEPMLASWGYQVRSARSGSIAKEMLERADGQFELLLTDIVMPGGIDGLTLARHVRGRYPSIGIVLMTGHARETDKAMAEGFVVLQKPWTPQALSAALQQAHPRQR